MTGRTGLARFSIWSRLLSESYPLFLGQCFSQSSSVQSGWVRFLGFGARRRAGVVSFVFVSASLSPSVAFGKKGESSLAVKTPADPGN